MKRVLRVAWYTIYVAVSMVWWACPVWSLACWKHGRSNIPALQAWIMSSAFFVVVLVYNEVVHAQKERDDLARLMRRKAAPK